METPQLLLTGSGSRSRAGFDDFHFRSQLEAGFHPLFNRVHLHAPRYIDPSVDYGVDLRGLFRATGLEPLVMCPASYSTAFVRLFYCNLQPGGTLSARSYMAGREVEITVADVAEAFGVPADGEDLWALTDRERADQWAVVNEELSGNPGGRRHNPNVHPYKRDAYLVQFVLRHGLFQKAGDKSHVNAPLALATYYCLRKIRFNVAEAVLRSICALSEIRTSRNPPNLAYGHIVQTIMGLKYEISPGNVNDAVLEPFVRKSIQYSIKPFGRDGKRRPDEARGARAAAADHAMEEDDAPDGDDEHPRGDVPVGGTGAEATPYHLLEDRVTQLERERSAREAGLRTMEDRLRNAVHDEHSRTRRRIRSLREELRSYMCCTSPAERRRQRSSSSSGNAMDAADQ